MKKLLCLFALTAILSGILSACGLKPLYADGRSGAVSSALSSISVDQIDGKAGWLVRQALERQLNPASNDDNDGKAFHLVVKLDDQIEGLGVRANDSVTRERRTLRARYQLIDNQSGVILLDKTAFSDAGIDIVGSEYATVAAENSALENLSQKIADQIIAQLANYSLNKGDATQNNASEQSSAGE
ncbi:hypothetical protein LPB140_12090 [Sphingorhabdus lutea]|uniref:LPS-assembly lipoprotein n=1 Tax=Sphingorhabdus lutea TaxID=1913578 RepID=A0A1L3J8P9_9SPHN|nr:LPS assembly lipoprotein LptE [Sphingorhabdus lutea]APG61498.1 hypothetical protein LPB140_00045 [Sphingorhabdus lutea]APG63403.1 hypothetical protein LPB140_12090 [Sphingorhabdus lutea]